MMEYGVPEKPKSFESKVLNVRFLMSDIFETSDKRKCRYFREKLVVAGKANSRQGTACQQAVAEWCKQVKGESMECRVKAKDGMFDAEMHNLDLKINNSLRSLPSF